MTFLVASLRLANTDMLRTGDWVEVPKYGADGDVIDIGLHTVKVQNWDKTISMIPTHAFMTDTFKNWRGMTESGGRRIKRSLSLDTSSIRFLQEEEIAHLGRVTCLEQYMQEKLAEVIEGVKADAVPGHESERNDAVDFLDFLSNHHFTLLGYRHYDLQKVEGDMALVADQDSSLGIMAIRPSHHQRNTPQAASHLL